jgi:hypothetical protein
MFADVKFKNIFIKQKKKITAFYNGKHNKERLNEILHFVSSIKFLLFTIIYGTPLVSLLCMYRIINYLYSENDV